MLARVSCHNGAMTIERRTSPLVVVGNIDADHHDTGDHPEQAWRLAAAHAGVAMADLTDVALFVKSREATTLELTALHSPEYIASLEHLCSRGGGHLDPDTPVTAGTWRTALHSAGAGLVAIDAHEAGAAEAGLVLTRPPGHHARPNGGMGFCLFNNIAVAAAALVQRGERVAIIDWDVHHGNGTQDAFWNNENVLFASIHQYPYYPGTGAVTETGGPGAPGLTINVPVPAGATGDVFLAAFDTLIEPVIEAFQPTWTLISAGFDAHRDDPLGDLRLASGDYADMTKRVLGYTTRHSRLVLFLEGGYDRSALSNSVGATASTLCGGGFRPEKSTSGGPGFDNVARAREAHQDALSL